MKNLANHNEVEISIDENDHDVEGYFDNMEVEEMESQCLSCARKCSNGYCEYWEEYSPENEDNNCWGYLNCKSQDN